MATVVGDRAANVDGVDAVGGTARVVADAVEAGEGLDVEVDALAAAVAEDPDRVAAQTPPAAPSTRTTTMTTSGAGRFHHGRFRRCLARMATTLAEPACWPADAGRRCRPGVRN
jgi:hypothetical protein